MVVVIKEEDAGKIIRALGLKRRIVDLERQIKGLQHRKAELEAEYKKLGIVVE